MRLFPERRRHWRIVTLKNAVWLLGGLIVLFLAVSAWNELRPGDPSRERLYERGGAGTPAAARPEPAEVDGEPLVEDETFAAGRDSGVLAPQPAAPPPAPVSVATPERPRPTTLKQARQRGQRIVITAGPDGLRVDAAAATTTTTETAVPPNRF
jgi:hypothetical protein